MSVGGTERRVGFQPWRLYPQLYVVSSYLTMTFKSRAAPTSGVIRTQC
jgi:hypothetical protein